MRPSFPAILLALSLAVPASKMSWAQELSSQPQSGGRVCVAVVRNVTTTSLFVERMTARLTKSLVENKLAAVSLESLTTDERALRPTLENAEELKSKGCDYVVLTQVNEPKAHPAEPNIPPITIGRRAPSTDASDPMGGESGPVSRNDLEVDFALFRVGKPSATMNGSLLEEPHANVSDSLVQSMDRIANRVKHELKKK